MFSLQPPSSRKRNRPDSEDDASLQTFHQQRRISKKHIISSHASVATDSIFSDKCTGSSTLFSPPAGQQPKPRSDAVSPPKALITPANFESDGACTTGYGYYDIEVALHDDTGEVTDTEEDDEMTGMGMDMDIDDGPILSPSISFASAFPSLSKNNKNKPYVSWCDSLNPAPVNSYTPPLSDRKCTDRAPSPASDNDSGVDCTTPHASPDSEIQGVGGEAIQTSSSSLGSSPYLTARGNPLSAPASLQDQPSKWSMGGTKNWGHVTGSVAGGGHGRVRLGYRADCVDCLKRKPGHFMHFGN